MQALPISQCSGSSSRGHGAPATAFALVRLPSPPPAPHQPRMHYCAPTCLMLSSSFTMWSAFSTRLSEVEKLKLVFTWPRGTMSLRGAGKGGSSRGGRGSGKETRGRHSLGQALTSAHRQREGKPAQQPDAMSFGVAEAATALPLPCRTAGSRQQLSGAGGAAHSRLSMGCGRIQVRAQASQRAS